MGARIAAVTTGWLRVPGAPAIDGLRFRRPHGDDSDYEAMAALVNAANREDDVPWASTGTNRREEIEGDEGSDVATDVILAEVDGQVVAESGVSRRMRGGRPVYELWGSVSPTYRRRGLGRALVEQNLRRVADRVASGEDRGQAHRIRAFANEGEVGHRALLASIGFTPARWFFLMRRPSLADVPDAPLPAGIELRAVRSEDHRAIFEAEYEAFLDHWEPHDHSEADFVSLFKRSELDTALWVVAWDGDQVAGVVQNWIWRDENAALGVKRGWLEHISVRRPWRRRGLGRAITAESLRRLQAAGMTEAMLGVDADNPTGALGLYEGLGFEMTQRGTAYWGPVAS